MYQRQMSEPNIPFPPQGFKQEYHDPVYEHNTMVGGAASQSFPPPLMIKQEPRDFAYDSGRPVLRFNDVKHLSPFRVNSLSVVWLGGS